LTEPVLTPRAVRRANIKPDDLERLKKLTAMVLSRTDQQIAVAVTAGEWREVKCDEEGNKYRSKLAGVVHRAAEGLSRAGALDKTTMREFDAMCLTTVQELSKHEIKRVRMANNVSQEVFANYLNVTPTLVSQWERGEKKPSGPSLKLLSLVKKKGLEAIA
jgi:putative transcriptional regulator